MGTITNLKSSAIFALLLIMSAYLEKTASADIYTYKDKNGVIHFTNKRKKGKKVRLWSREKEKKKRNRRASQKRKSFPSQYKGILEQAAQYYQLPVSLVHAVIKVESNYNRYALSSVGAQGLMQLMPATARHMGVTDPWDPYQNIFGGCRYLRLMANRYQGDLHKTIAAYHSGPGNVSKATDHLYGPNTRIYLNRVLKIYLQLRR